MWTGMAFAMSLISCFKQNIWYFASYVFCMLLSSAGLIQEKNRLEPDIAQVELLLRLVNFFPFLYYNNEMFCLSYRHYLLSYFMI